MKNQASGQLELSSYSCFWHLFFAECHIGGERNEMNWYDHPSNHAVSEVVNIAVSNRESVYVNGGVDHLLSPARPWAIRFDSCHTSAVDWRWWMILHIPVVLLSRNAHNMCVVNSWTVTILRAFLGNYSSDVESSWHLVISICVQIHTHYYIYIYIYVYLLLFLSKGKAAKATKVGFE